MSPSSALLAIVVVVFLAQLTTSGASTDQTSSTTIIDASFSSSSPSLPLLAFPFPGGEECESDAERLCSTVLRTCRGTTLNGCTLQCLTDHIPIITGACLAAHPCYPDIDRYCSSTPPGQNKMMMCLKKHSSLLSSECIAQHPCLAAAADDCKTLDYGTDTEKGGDPLDDMKQIMHDLNRLRQHAVAQGKAIADGHTLSLQEEAAQVDAADERATNEAEEEEDQRQQIIVGVVKLKHHSPTDTHTHSVDVHKTTDSNANDDTTSNYTSNMTVPNDNGDTGSVAASSIQMDDNDITSHRDYQRSRQVGHLAAVHDTLSDDATDIDNIDVNGDASFHSTSLHILSLHLLSLMTLTFIFTR